MSVTVDDVVKVMLDLRDKRSALKKAYEEADEHLKEKFKRGETFLKNHLNTTKQDSFTAGGATVYTTSTMKASVPDKAALFDCVRTTGEVELLEARISKTALKEYIERNDGRLPPGVAVEHELTVNIRKKAAKK